jgi:Na+/phosphate symporter
MKTKRKSVAGILVLSFVLSFLSAMPDRMQAQPLSPVCEVQAVGGSVSDRCASAWGLGLGLAAASLSPCSIVCLTLAWYDLALIAAFCE